MFATDVIVIGGGPAGLHAAYCLAREGIEVLLVEEHLVVGQPVHCTGILGTEALDQFDLPRDAVLNRLQTARLHSPAGQIFEYASDSVDAVVLDRQKFDFLLFKRARAQGVEFKLHSKIIGITIRDDQVSVESSDGQVLRARACILAAGANYSLHRKLGLGFPAAYLHSAQIELSAAEREHVELFFGTELARGGFGWAVPVRRQRSSHVRIGVISRDDALDCFKRVLANVSEAWDIHGPVEVNPRRKILPLAPVQKTFLDRLLVVGDAAGLVKATTGGGIYYSLLSAALAAGVLLQGIRSNNLSESFLSAYERQWKKQLHSEFEAQLAFRHMAEHLRDPDMEALFDIARTDGLIPLIRKTARFNYHRGLISALLKHREVGKILLRRIA